MAESSIRTPLRIGAVLLVLVFGVFGTWSALAPLEGAAHAPGRVTVASYSKTVQHLEGGIVAEIHVANGDRVAAGQPLLRLDETQSLAQLEIARTRLTALRVMEARLLAERDGLRAVAYPEDLRAGDARVRQEMAAQEEIFAARAATQEASLEILAQRVEQLRAKVEGLQALMESKQVLERSYADELADTRALLSQGFADKNRLRELERALATYTGEVADLRAQIASTRVQIGETRMTMIQLERELHNEVVNQLAETQTAIDDAQERIGALQDVVARTVIRSPVAGIVDGLQVHTIGGVIAPGTPILTVVPEGEDLIVEAMVSPNDIDRVAVDEAATIRFSAFGRAVPPIAGRVVHLSADSFVEETTGRPYYQARIAVTDEGRQDLGSMLLLPGMPAEVFISTGSRTFLQYLFKPVTEIFARSFIED